MRGDTFLGLVSRARLMSFAFRQDLKKSRSSPSRCACDCTSLEGGCSPPPSAPGTYPVEDARSSLHGDALEHSQHGEGEVVEIAMPLLGPGSQPGLHTVPLCIAAVARLQGTGRGVVFLLGHLK